MYRNLVYNNKIFKKRIASILSKFLLISIVFLCLFQFLRGQSNQRQGSSRINLNILSDESLASVNEIVYNDLVDNAFNPDFPEFGLENKANECNQFINAGLQVLWHVQALRDAVLKCS